jgi:hypothetical protein
MKYSVIVLLEEKNQDFSQFVHMLYETFSSMSEQFEILIVANGTEGFLMNELPKFSAMQCQLKAFALNKKTSQAVCLKSALSESSGDVIVACGSYQQIAGDSFKSLLESFDDEVDIISPWRQNRVDPPFNRIQSWAFNTLVKKITRSDLNDLSCTVKIFRREVLEEVKLYGNMYRFLPIIATRLGFIHKEVKCEHFQEHGKTGFYRISEYIERILDICTLYFNMRFSKKPLRFFSAIGSIFLIIGIIIMFNVFFQKLVFNHPIGDSSVLLLSVLFMVLGAQAASVGFLGEIIAFTHGRRQKEYTIEKKI